MPVAFSTEVIGHRGAAGHAPENTMLSFEKAVELGADRIEFDVRCSAEGEPVVFHDERLERTTNGKGRVAEKTVKELKALDAGSWFSLSFSGATIPTLEEVLMKMLGKIKFNIEIKAKGCEQRIVELIQKHKASEAVVISSFNIDILKTVRQAHRELKLQLLLSKPLNLKKIKDEVDIEAVNPFFLLASKRFLKSARDLGLKVNVWTVDDELWIKKMAKLGVDGIISNYPDRVRQALRELQNLQSSN